MTSRESLVPVEHPCGCKHNGFAEAEGSEICDQHFFEDRLHFCTEWDFLLIDKNSPEFESCICTFPEKP